MVRKRWFTLLAGTLVLAAAQSAQASDTIRLGGSIGGDTLLLDRGDDSDAATELARYGGGYRGGYGGGYRGGYGGGFRVGYGGGYRGGYGGYRGGFGYYGGYRGGYVGYRGGFGYYGGYRGGYGGYYGSNWGYGGYASYPVYSYPVYSYPVYSYPVYSSYYYSPCVDSTPTTPAMPYATYLDGSVSTYSQPSTVLSTPAPVTRTPAPPAGDGTFRYDGGSGVIPMPMPVPDGTPVAPTVTPRPTLPLEGRLVSLPSASSTAAYPAYGEPARRTSTPAASSDTRLVSTPVATPRVAFPAYGEGSPRK